MYYLSWPLGFCISASVWIFLNTVWPPPGLGEVDDEDRREITMAEEQLDDLPEKSAANLERVVEELQK